MTATDRYLHPEFRKLLGRFEQLLRAKGLHVRITCGYRSLEEQARLYRQRPRVTRARPGQSPHNWGLAADFCFEGPQPYAGDWETFGRLAKEAGLAWGGGWLVFKDRPHVELPNWKQYRGRP